MPCTMGAWYCGWGDHNLPQDTSCDIFILYCHLIFAFHRKTHLRCITSVLLHYNCKINANIQDVYHRPNFERAPKGRLPLVLLKSKALSQYFPLCFTTAVFLYPIDRVAHLADCIPTKWKSGNIEMSLGIVENLATYIFEGDNKFNKKINSKLLVYKKTKFRYWERRGK